MNSADQIGQLNDLRYKMQPGKNNASRGKSEIISENEIPGMGKKFRKQKLATNMGDAAGRIEIGDIEKHGTFVRMPFSEIPVGAPLIEGRFVYTVGNNPTSADQTKNRGMRWRK